MDIPFHRNHPDPARATIARELARYYDELAGADGTPTPRFSVARALHEAATEHGLRDGFERELCGAAATMAGGTYDPHRLLIPFSVLRRDMKTTGTTGEAYLVGGAVADVVDVLRPWSVVAAAGITVMPGLVESLSMPRVTTKGAAGWLNSEGVTQTTDAQPTLGNVLLTPKSGAAHIAQTRQFRIQTEQAEPFARDQLAREIGELLDVAFFAGSGINGQPLGLLATPGINTVSGTSLAHAGVLEMREEALAAGAREDRLQWVGATAVQELLGSRERASGGGRFLWDSDGILGRPAHATRNAPTATLVCGDYSSALLGLWGPPALRVEVDPYSSFTTGAVRARVILMCDFAFPNPGAFTVATSIT